MNGMTKTIYAAAEWLERYDNLIMQAITLITMVLIILLLLYTAK